MSNEIAAFYTNTYMTGIGLLAQQMQSVTAGTTREEGKTGKKVSFDFVDKVRSQRKTGRNQTMPYVHTPHRRRWVTNVKDWLRDNLDEDDDLQTLQDPTNSYAQSQVLALLRERDKLTVDAAVGTSYAGNDDDPGLTPITLPSSQIVLDGGTGMTLDKLQQAMGILKSANVIQPGPLGAMGEKVSLFWTERQEREFISQNEVANWDYNTLRVLQKGGLEEQFYGIHYWRRLEDFTNDAEGRMLPRDEGNDVRDVLLIVESGLVYNTARGLRGRVWWKDDSESYDVGTSLRHGAARLKETHVVVIKCKET